MIISYHTILQLCSIQITSKKQTTELRNMLGRLLALFGYVIRLLVKSLEHFIPGVTEATPRQKENQVEKLCHVTVVDIL